MTNYWGFPKNLISAVVCQIDKAALNLENESTADNLMNGYLVCSACGQRYEIKDGILNLLVGQKGLDDILKSEIKARDGDAAGYNKRLAGRYYKEVLPTLKNLDNLSGKKIIEYGCGAGRFTLEIEKSCQEILAVDFSLSSLSCLSASLKTNNVGLVLADATQIKTKENYFDIALATQFFEHIPTAEQRKNFLRQAQRTLKIGGVIICTVYHYDLRQRFKNLPEEGYHDNKIYFRYYGKKEIKDLFKSYFKKIKIKFIDITLPLEARLKLPAKIGGIISRINQPIYPLNRLAHLLLIKGAK